jgi:hypothetical protein
MNFFGVFYFKEKQKSKILFLSLTTFLTSLNKIGQGIVFGLDE